MDNRPPLSAQRPSPAQRAVGGSPLHFPKSHTRPNLPSRLSSVRSVSQPGDVVDLTADGVEGSVTNAAAFLGNHAGPGPSLHAVDWEDKDGAPAAKKAKTSGPDFRSEDGEQDMAYRTALGSPLPTLPKARPSKAAVAVRDRSAGECPARRANGLEPPSMATRLPPPKKAADFSPWTGNHPEDTMNETVVKAGYFDKGSGANLTECNSAKPSIWPNLNQKNNMGLQTLSHLYTQVMDKRQVLGKCTAPSTFKPPPRVTVTDTKREAWLRDLANPEIPLRKQSRTIPHGIRGRLLMDQCLAKDIPLQRAVWLAKCVGANELRAFRRKGISGAAAASGERKWIREWTAHVEQFLESVVASCGQPEWSSKMNYAAKVVTAIYTEKLLDADHYLDWIVTSLADAPVEKLPIWIILVQIYWKDIVGFVRRGRRLAQGILGHLDRLVGDNVEANETLKNRLQQLIAVLAVTSRGCLVIPRTWNKYKHLLTPSTASDLTGGETAAQDVAKRNERLIDPMRKTSADARNELLDLYGVLDSVGLDVDVDTLTAKVSAIVPDPLALVSALLNWASSPYRQGLARTYLAAQVVSNLRKNGYDTDTGLLEKLRTAAKSIPTVIEGIYKVIVELVRLNSFSAGRYMQWLITSGALSDAEESHAAAGLLAALPCDNLPLHLQNTMKSLLRRLGATAGQQGVVQDFLTSFETALRQLSSDGTSQVHLPDRLGLPEKNFIGERIRLMIRDISIGSAMNTAQYCTIRGYLESIEDIPPLIELIDASVDTNDATLQATVIDTINMHAQSLATRGQLSRLSSRAVEQYRHLRSRQPLDRTLILALRCLAKRLGNRSNVVELLASDLAACEQQNTLAVCSPASDNLVGMHASSLDTDRDIAAVFASGDTMDEQLLQRVFVRVVQRASKPTDPEQKLCGNISRWFNQLRTVGGSGFDQLAQNFLRTYFKNASDATAPSGAVTAMIGSGCVSLDAVANTAKDAASPLAALTALRLLVEPRIANPDLSSAEQYRYNLKQVTFGLEHLPLLAKLFGRALESPIFDPGNVAMGDLFIRLSTRSLGTLEHTLDLYCRSPASMNNAGKVAMSILERGDPSALADRELDLKAMVRSADALSVRFCASALKYTVRGGGGCKGFSGDRTMLYIIIDAVTGGSTVWPVLLDAVNQQTKRALHDWAQDQLLHETADPHESDEHSLRDMTSRYLDVLSATCAFVKEDDDVAIITTLAEKLRTYESQLMPVVAEPRPAWSQSLLLNTLLQVCALHVQTPAAETDAARQSRGNLLLALCSLLVHTTLQTQRDTTDYIFDLASTLADSLPQSVVAAMARSSAGLRRRDDPRVRSILGDVSSTSKTWLALASHVPPAGSHQQQQQQQPRGGPNKFPLQQGQSSIGRPAPYLGASQPAQQQRSWPHVGAGANRTPAGEVKTTPYPLRMWEVIPDPTPVIGENDTSLSLRLFGARKA